MGRHEVSDYEINGTVRREIASLGIDLSGIHYRCSGGAVEITGKLKFHDPKSPAEAIKFLMVLEDQISKIRGVKRVRMDFEDWEKNAGKWGRAFEEEKEEKKEEEKEKQS
jgi:hypothetical protein